MRISSDKTTLLAGSGMSIASGLPSGMAVNASRRATRKRSTPKKPDGEATHRQRPRSKQSAPLYQTGEAGTGSCLEPSALIGGFRMAHDVPWGNWTSKPAHNLHASFNRTL